MLNMEGRPVMLDDASHPVNSRLALAKPCAACSTCSGSSGGTRNGHYAPFSWSG